MQEKGALEKEVEKIYTPLSVAKEEIWRRWNDKALRKKVEDFLGGDIPEVFKKEPRAVLLRYIATPNFETIFFIDLASETKLKPLCGEFLKDKFCTINQTKAGLAKMSFFHGVKMDITSKNIVETKKNEGKPFCEVTTLSGKKLVDCHHEIFNTHCPNIETFNAYCLRANNKDAGAFYEKMFTIFLCFGVLFENFITKDYNSEKKFTKEVVLPAYRKIVEEFKLRPLVSPIASIENEENKEWNWYSGKMKKEVDLW